MNEEFGIFAVKAIEWARTQLGSDAYPLRCLSFVEDAYERSNHIEIFGGSSAQESADQYEACKNSGPPPAGAFVFYECSGLVDGENRNWGHVGLADGDGNVIHAWGRVRVDPYLAVEGLEPAAGWTRPKLIGWAPVELVLSGHKKKDWEQK